MTMDQTQLFDRKELTKTETKIILKEVYDLLEEKGYNPTNQIVGYLVSGDLAFISNYKDARKKINTLDRNDILEELVLSYLND